MNSNRYRSTGSESRAGSRTSITSNPCRYWVSLMKKGETRVITSSTLDFHSLELYRHKAKFGITIHDDYQNRGLGTALTQYMINITHERGTQKVDLMVVAHNKRAIRVYKKLDLD